LITLLKTIYISYGNLDKKDHLECINKILVTVVLNLMSALILKCMFSRIHCSKTLSIQTSEGESCVCASFFYILIIFPLLRAQHLQQKRETAPIDGSLIEGCTLQSLKKGYQAGFKWRFTECL